MTYREAENYISRIPRFSEKHPLEHTRELLHGLYVKKKDFKIIHVAGTNGKGSVCNYLNQILLEAGRTVGLFTSPHLLTMRERIRINGEMISEEAFTEAFDQVMVLVQKKQNEGMSHPTFFEFLFLMAMEAFHLADVDYVILETGMGGRLDTTNIVSHPLVTVLTSISLDHMQYLGNTIAQVTYEKIGIMKPGVPVVYYGGNPESASIIHHRAADLHCPEYPVTSGSVEVLQNDGRKIRFRESSGDAEYVLNTGAVYQPVNAEMAVQAAGILGITDEKLIASALFKAHWPGRMDEIRPGVYVDGGHNPEGIEMLLDNLAILKKNGRIPGEISLIFAVTDEKDYKTMIRMLGNEDWKRIVTTTFPSSRSLDAELLAELFRKTGTESDIQVEKDPKQAFLKVLGEKKDTEVILACGSLYLAGTLLSLFEGKEQGDNA